MMYSRSDEEVQEEQFQQRPLHKDEVIIAEHHILVDPVPFQSGDIVHLKSGSGRLTVVRAGRDESICCWIDYNTQNYHEHTIKNCALRKE